MNKIKLSCKLIPVLGIGYYKNIFNGEYDINGYCHVLYLPFLIIRWGEFTNNKIDLVCPDCFSDLSYCNKKLKFIKHN